MKTDVSRLLLVAVSMMALSACGQNQVMSSSFQKLSDACAGNALPQQFIVKHLDNSIEVIHADSEEEFINGYMKANAGKIRYAEHDYRVFAAETAQPVSADNTTIVADNWGAINVQTDALWAQNVRGSTIVVAVVDSGMDLTHPQLQNQVFFNPGESGGGKETNGIDDDGNGYIDDYAGYDFVANQPLKGDYQYHGTHVSGIVAAYHQDTVAKSASYVQGVAPDAKILPLAFMSLDPTTGEVSGKMSDAVRAIEYAVQRGARVINASWGGTGCSQSLRDEIASLESRNVAFIAAAGNDGQDVDSFMEYPASLNLAAQITVGATGDHDYMADYSNYGAKAVHIFAPGTNIVSTLPGGVMGFLSGTSMATPFVSGGVALLLGAVPNATVAQVRQALYASAAHDVSYINASQGRMNLAQALTILRSIVGP